MVHNSEDISGVKATFQPLYNFAERETAAGRPVVIQTDSSVLTSYFSLFPTPPDQAREGAGLAVVSGSRLLPISILQDSVDPLVDIFIKSPKNRVYPSLMIMLGKRLLSYFLQWIVSFLRLSIFHLFCIKTANYGTSKLIALIYPVGGGKLNEVALDATSIHPFWRKATHHVVLLGEWETETPFEERDAMRRKVTHLTQAMGRLVPEAGAYHNEYVKKHSRTHRSGYVDNMDNI